jgi:tetratricopeptide (TPR) repeat protein
LSSWTYDRNSVWNSKITLWSDCAAKSPGKARPHNNLGYALKQQGRLKEALAHYQQTIRIDPEFFEAYNNIGNIYMIFGKFDKAIENYNMSLKIKPGNPLVHMNIGNAFVKLWQLEKALLHYGEALHLKPDYEEARLRFLSTQNMIDRKKARTRQ